MSIFSLSLIFMSPVIAYATYLLLNENRDPLKGFHDDFLRNFRSQQKDFLARENRDESQVPDKSKTRNQVVIIVFSFAIVILFLMGASFVTILLLTVTLFIFRYWEKGFTSRNQKNRLEAAESEFPSIVELFAVLVSAGESL
jgi:Flp pilus assembly protein TadB